MAENTRFTSAGERAAESGRSVAALFGGKLLGLPLTHLAAVSSPAPPFVGGSWNYWWQAHYLDAVTDAGLRLAREGDERGARHLARRGDRLLFTIWLRNVGHFTNAYYDDMAWLALAVGRLRSFNGLVGAPGGASSRRLESADRALTARLRSAMTPAMGGGVFWNTKRDFKNVPATGPTALHLARHCDLEAAAALVEWMYERLFAPDTGLFLDGIRLTRDGERVVTHLFTYNQGTVLGSLLAVGGSANLARAEALVGAVAARLTVDAKTGRPLATHDGGDGGLFTGILVRYLAQAATDSRLSSDTRATAGLLVFDTAESFWSGRAQRTLADGRLVTVFSPDAARPAARAQPGGAVVELSTQVQAWTVLEAAAVVDNEQPAATST